LIEAPREAQWFWGLDFFEWQGSDGPQYGNAANREAAMKAFRAAMYRERAKAIAYEIQQPRPRRTAAPH
jgi:hypothetical protein